jgi:hypothetical protein
MTMMRDPRKVIVLAGLLLVALWAVQASDAGRRSVGRAAAAAFDGPTAQFHESLTAPGLVDLDVACLPREPVGAACAAARRLGASPDRGRREADTLGARLTRPPPSA